MRVSVFGLGYVGCVTAACLAKAGHEVVGVDVNKEKVAMVNGATSPIVEPDLGDLLRDVVMKHRLRATTSGREAVAATEVGLVCVGTPSGARGQLSVSALERVGYEIGASMRRTERPFTVVLRSTVLPGTTDDVFIPAIGTGAGDAFGRLQVAVNPEFMREGSAIRDFEAPPLTLVGCQETPVASQLRALYGPIEAPFIQTSIRTAEMVKYASNAFHALKVCFANELGDICEALGADPQEVMRVFRMDRKLNVSDAYLKPGFAFGGSCLPKDVRAMLHAARSADVAVPLLSTILPSNDAQIRKAIDAVVATRKRRVGIVGLAFKPGTDDLRESPMVTLVEALIGKGLDVKILDRNVSVARLVGANRAYIEEEIPHIASLMCEDLDPLLRHAEVVVIGNNNEESAAALARLGEQHTLVDLTRGAARRPAPPMASAA
ncbi:MAG TPA: nucleotide sugar dehydrogenase [Methylomirabilota bacterium]|jgi:GDP-mannose 6-dehydrogenase|nr:nucleotide sugar dehydrogenase [Methylomirabilota bacterium]